MSLEPLQNLKILFYTDARHFGGHEVASLNLIGSLLHAGVKIQTCTRKDNHILSHRLNVLQGNFSNLKTYTLTVPTLKYANLAGLLYNNYLRRLNSYFRDISPDIVFVSQGNLGSSWAGAHVARDLGLPCLSYIPMAQPLRLLLGKKGWIRDCLGRQAIHWPNHWLTCTEEQVKHLRAAGAKQPISVLPNPIDIRCCATRKCAREKNCIPTDALVIGMVGRLNNRQKGCDLFVNALLESCSDSLLRQAWILFIGDGEERQAIETRLNNAGWKGRIRFTGWTHEPWHHYTALDLLVMPSRFEGQPLAMQEALMCGVPVCASRIGGFRGFLPDAWLFQPNNSIALRERLELLLKDGYADKTALETLQHQIITKHGMPAIASTFFLSLKTLLTAKTQFNLSASA